MTTLLAKAKIARAAAFALTAALLPAPATAAAASDADLPREPAPFPGAGLLVRPPRITAFKLDAAAPELPLLYAFHNAAIERPGPLRTYLGGQYGRWSKRPWWNLVWAHAPEVDAASDAARASPSDTSPAPSLPPDGALNLLGSAPEAPAELALPAPRTGWLHRLDPAWSPPIPAGTGPSLASNGFDVLWEIPKKPVPNWRCRRRPVQFIRYGGEAAFFRLVRCDGSIPPGTLDRLSIMARPPDAPTPGDVLPDEPDADAWRSLEWVPQVRIANPRLAWLLQRISDAFPWRPIYIISGYRPLPEGAPRRGHHSLHAEGRAMDIMVLGIPNVAIFKLCRTLNDVGCGFYPNSKFVHVDVRRPGTGRAFWIDISGPGEPAHYVDAWPGVVERGGMVWGSSSGESTSSTVTEAPSRCATTGRASAERPVAAEGR